jgi:hypothetical protein
MMVIAFEHFKNGDEKLATKNMLAAMGSDDFEAIANGILLMNKKSDLALQADDSSDTSDDTEDSDDDLTDDDDSDDTDSPDADSDDMDTDEDADDDDLEDSDIEDAVSDKETTASDEDEDEDADDSTETNKEEKPTVNKEADKKPTPMGKTSSELTASHTSKVLANKLSLDGSTLNRNKARDFLAKNRNL